MKRKVDGFGRIVLPDEYRAALNIREKDELDILLEANQITIQKPITGCHFCGSTEHLVQVGGEAVCESCIQRLCEAKDGDVISPVRLGLDKG